MKIHFKFSILLIFCFMYQSAINPSFSQSPQRMSYQAVIRNSSNVLVASSPVGVRISILQGTATGTEVYKEIFNPNPQTNVNGLITIEIGGGIPITGTFTGINWSSGPYYIKTETDPSGGTNYSITITSQLLSVPYALFAKKAESLTGGITETDPIWVASSANYYTKSNMQTNGSSQLHFNNLSNKPTTVIGYGITDAVNTTSNQTIAGNKTFSGITSVVTPVNATDATNKAYVDAILEKVLQIQADLGTVDIDGNSYKAVKIGTQVWMSENLKTTKYNDGTDISIVTGSIDWSGLTTPAMCWYNNDALTYKNPYGALYNWHTVNTGKLCPFGWHIPSDSEWTILTSYLGGTSVAGGKLKEAGTNHWTSPNYKATNELGFTALPGSYRYYDGSFYPIGMYGSYWSSTVNSSAPTEVFHRAFHFDLEGVGRGDERMVMGFSVRCIKD